MKENQRASKKIRKGDKVIVRTGNDRGQTGSVLRIIGDKAIVQGINIRKKHVKRSEANPKGGIVEIERPIHLSNLQVCNDDNKPVKLQVRIDESGSKALYYKIDGQEVLHRTIKK